MKAAEEKRQQEEEEEKRKAAERKREEKRQEREVRCDSYFMGIHKNNQNRRGSLSKPERHVADCTGDTVQNIKLMSVCVHLQREEEKQRQLKRQQELLKVARQHYHMNLLLRRGLAPWKRLIQLREANMQVNHLSVEDGNRV